MERVSAEDVEAIVNEANPHRFSLHICSECQKTVYYHFDNDTVTIDNCCNNGGVGTRPSSYGGVATSFNRLDPVSVRPARWREFLMACRESQKELMPVE